MIEQVAELTAHNLTFIGFTFFANLILNPPFPEGVQQSNATAINHPDQGRFDQKAISIVPMTIEQPKQPGSVR